MADESPPFALQASSYGAEITRRAIASLLQRGATIGSVAGGIVAPTDCQLSAPASGMSVLVSAGELVVPGSSSATQSGYYCRISSQNTLTIAASNPSNPRIDRVVGVVADAAYSGSTNSYTTSVVTGTPTAGATLTNLNGAAAAPASSLTLGYVLVPATATNIISADILNVATTVHPGPTAFSAGLDASKPLAGTVTGFFYYATDSNALYYSDGTTWRTVQGSRGSTNIATSQSVTNTAYTTLATPDQVTNVVLPTAGLIAVSYQATWQSSVANAARAAILLNGTQMEVASPAALAPLTQAAAMGPAAVAATNYPLASDRVGLFSGTANAYPGDVTTGQAVGIVGNGASLYAEFGGTVTASPSPGAVGGPCFLFAAAGSYTVSVQFKASSGSVTASNRKLWVQALPFA